MKRLFSLLLSLFPRAYREEYGDELQAVFNTLLDDAIQSGWLEVTGVVLREMIGLPKAIFYEHLRAMKRSNMTAKFASRFDFAPGSWTEAFAALAPFLLFGALPTLLGYFQVLDNAPTWLYVIAAILFWSLALCLLVVGFIKRFPRWFMPYIGVPMPFLSLMLFNNLVEKWQGVWWYRLPWFVSAFIQEGLLWMGLVFLLLLLLVATRLVPKSRPFHWRLRDDWTLLSFIIYGTMPLVLLITYNEYKNVEPFMFLSLVILAAGGWLYLQSYESLKRFVYLHVGVALSMMTAAVGKAILYASSFGPLPRSFTWHTEAISTMITWLWLSLIMLIPPALNLLLHPNNSSQAAHLNQAR